MSSSEVDPITSDPFDQADDDDYDLYTSAIGDSMKTSQAEPMLPNNQAPATLPSTPYENGSPSIRVQSPQAPKKSLHSFDEAEEDQYIDISVTEPSRKGDGMGSYVEFQINTRTNIKLFKARSFSVRRRFSDFLGVHDKLVSKYLRAGRIIPPAPEKSVIGMTKIKMSSSAQPEQNSSSEFVERRRASLERYLKRTALHPVLRIDPDFREFLEADHELPKAHNTSVLSGAGVMRLFNKVGETVNKMTYKMDESDPWFEEKTQYIEQLDCNLRNLHLSVETLVMHRKDLAVFIASFAKSAAMLSNCEEHTSLSRALSQLAETEEKIEALHNEQANADFSIFCELLKDYIALVGAIRDVFHERVKVYQTWQHSQLMLNKKREQKVKMELNMRTDKSSTANQEVAEWEAKVERCQEEFNSISKMIREELEQFDVNRVKDFKETIIKYLESMLDHQQNVMKCWEQFLPEAQLILVQDEMSRSVK